MRKSVGILARLAFVAIVPTLVVGPASSVIVATSLDVLSHGVRLAGKTMPIPVGEGLTGLAIGRSPLARIHAYTQRVGRTSIGRGKPELTDGAGSGPPSTGAFGMPVPAGVATTTFVSTEGWRPGPACADTGTSRSDTAGGAAPTSTTAWAGIPASTTTWAMWTAAAAGSATGTATFTAQALPPCSSLLERLAEDKPSLWGNRYFYVTLGVLYVLLLGILLRQVSKLSGQD